MKVFISWSGDRSRAVASALREWLPDVIQGVEPWMSSSDIEAGARWSLRVQEELEKSNFGIICVTAENQSAPWLLFEAGAIAKSVAEALVVPYLIGLTPAELIAGPLTQFQAKQASRSDTLEIIRAINSNMKERALPVEKVDHTFERWWPDLERVIDTLPIAISAPRRTNDDLLQEILLTVRAIALQQESYDSPGQPPHLRVMGYPVEYGGRRFLQSYRLGGSQEKFVKAIVNGVMERLEGESASRAIDSETAKPQSPDGEA